MEISKVVDLNSLIQYVTVGFAVVSVVFAIVLAMKEGVLRKITLGNIEIEANAPASNSLPASESLELIQNGENHDSYEIKQLGNYYAQILSQSKISFWFSLIFASLGFAVIVIAVLTYKTENVGTTVASFIAGTIIDAVSALFFVQSRSAQKAMGEFFDKLRRDRQQHEARRMCESIDNPSAKDAMRIQLVMHFAEVEEGKNAAQSIIKDCLFR